MGLKPGFIGGSTSPKPEDSLDVISDLPVFSYKGSIRGFKDGFHKSVIIRAL